MSTARRRHAGPHASRHPGEGRPEAAAALVGPVAVFAGAEGGGRIASSAMDPSRLPASSPSPLLRPAATGRKAATPRHPGGGCVGAPTIPALAIAVDSTQLPPAHAGRPPNWHGAPPPPASSLVARRLGCRKPSFLFSFLFFFTEREREMGRNTRETGL